MKTLLRLAFLLLLCQMALGQATNVPLCLPSANTPGTCTDYFGVANWAYSPLPAGPIGTLNIRSAGQFYAAPVITITDLTGAGSGATATATLDVNGSITALNLGNAGSGYIMPQVSIVDSGCGGALQPACGTGASAFAVITPATGGIKKFQDAFFDLKNTIAKPDAATFPVSDYYEIQLRQYTQSFSPANGLPLSTLRGYVQVPTGSTGCNATPVVPQNYLGPVILAQKNRPVRVKFTNCLPADAGGDLFIPVDTTYMGAGNNASGQPYAQSRATLHLHGGATPWISDGTPHQWTVPVGNSAADQKGASVAYVPDMWFDASGKVISSCAGQSTCAASGATNNPGQGSLSFFWTNAQGGRLMFYHDHAYGLTRLNVYAGEAAGYLLYDPQEESALLAGTAPGTLATSTAQPTPDIAHLIPLVIQDKTFVPSVAEINATDPTWKNFFGTTPGTVHEGDLWFPHVYTTNQNPSDPSGGNAFGRWDYGPWFFPPQTSLTGATPPTNVYLACTSSAFPGQTLQPTASCPTCGCPITPNPAGTPESFMDTPVVNGVAYPVLNVAPAAYRFKILSAGNDRSLHLSWFVADPLAPTEVHMVPAVPPFAGSAIPLCGPVNPVAVLSLGIGLDTGILNASGNPLNGTGLPAGCWPNYGPISGIPPAQTMWAADGRNGGVPDPRTAGPAWIQIGSEGGLLPKPVVIPATPVNYEQNPRSITITSVGVHGLWLGPAERADVIVDFSQAPVLCAAHGVSPCTLILYNDAPTPAPAYDTRLDYFTGDGDQTDIGGAPNTVAGYGPNTRTIMQVVVSGSNNNTVPFSLPTLTAAFASNGTAAPGVYAATQPTTIVAEPQYNTAYRGIYPNQTTNQQVGISDTTMSFTPYVPQTFNNPCGTTCDNMDQKTIQELFTVDYGKLNATLGTELANVNFQNQTTIPLNYVDPATEILRPGNTQLWKITHNGVDTHFIHFHLYNVQVINRVGWDGSMRPIDANEYGWKDTVRMNPLEDITVALQPITPTVPFPLANSIRLLDVTAPTGAGGNPPFSLLDPYSNGAANTVNELQNFGWEYVWHCHILGHEENDMMRAQIFQVAPPAPSNLAVASVGVNATITFTDNSASETGFTIQRSTDSAFLNPAPTILPPVPASPTRNAAGEGTDWGSTITVSDTLPDTVNTYFYRVQAVDDGWLGGMSQTYNSWFLGTSAVCGMPSNGVAPIAVGNCPLLSGWSNTASAQMPKLTITASSAIVNYGAPVPTITPIYSGFQPGDNPSNSLTTLPTCTTTYTPTSPVSGSPYSTSCSGAVSSKYQIVYVAGTVTVTAAPLSITASSATITYGSAVPAITPSYAGFVNGENSTVLTTQPTCSTTATNSSPVGTYPSTCTGAAAANYTINYVAGAVTITKASLVITASSGTMSYGGTPPIITPSYAGFVNGDTAAVLTPGPTCSTTATSTSPVGSYPSTCSGAAAVNYSISYLAGTVVVTKANTTTTITSHTPNPSARNQAVTISFTVAPQFSGTPTGNVTVTASSGGSCTATVAAGSCTISFPNTGNFTLTATYAGNGNFNGSTSAAVTQTVGTPQLTISPTSLSRPQSQSVPVGTTVTLGTFTLSSSGSTPATLNSFTIGGTNAGDFAIAPATTCVAGQVIPIGSPCTIVINFTPHSRTPLQRNGTLTVNSVSSQPTRNLSLRGYSQ